MLARRETTLAPLAKEIEADGARATFAACDVVDASSVSAAAEALRREFGDPQVMIYNPGIFPVGGLLEVSPAQLEESLRISCMGAFLFAREVVPAMLSAGKGTMIFTGATASWRGSARFGAFAAGKFALRALVQSMARELQPKGIHVAHVVVDGQIEAHHPHDPAPSAPGDRHLSPTAIADTYWHLFAQPRSAWTHELDLRPATEVF